MKGDLTEPAPPRTRRIVRRTNKTQRVTPRGAYWALDAAIKARQEPYERLFLAVIGMALIDCTHQSEIVRIRARRFLRTRYAGIIASALDMEIEDYAKAQGQREMW